MLGLAALEKWHITSLDIRNAYLYGKLDEEIYMEQPKGHTRDTGIVLRLWRAIYGLKQVGLAWWHQLNAFMKELGFKQLKSEARIFQYGKVRTNIVVGVVYVDDTFFCGPDKILLNEIKTRFMKKWEYRDLGNLSEFLQICIVCHDHKILIYQTNYLIKILQYFQMKNMWPTPTLLPSGYHLQKYERSIDYQLQKCFQTIIGSLLYLMLGTRPDIAFTVT